LNKSIFISKDLSEVTILQQFCLANNINLIAHSLIRFEAIPFQVNQTYDVLFISSIRAAEFFLKTEKIKPETVIACIGQTTASKLEELGLKITFVGEKSGNPIEVAEEFKKWLGNRTVLIPQSNISNRTIGSLLPSSQCIEPIVYKTVSDCEVIPICETYIFTSPSNVDSFLTCNEPPQGKVIAWGETTKKCIEEKSITVSNTLQTSGMEELIKLL
jgi:uroporphyrinogen-III synthase